MKKLLKLALCLLPSFAMAQTGNTFSTPLPLTTYTAATVNSGTQANASYQCGHIIINVVTATSGTYTPHIQGLDQVSGVWYDILIGSTISASGTTILKVCPGIAALANGAAADFLPVSWRVQLIGASAPSMILSVGVNLAK